MYFRVQQRQCTTIHGEKTFKNWTDQTQRFCSALVLPMRKFCRTSWAGRAAGGKVSEYASGRVSVMECKGTSCQRAPAIGSSGAIGVFTSKGKAAIPTETFWPFESTRTTFYGSSTFGVEIVQIRKMSPSVADAQRRSNTSRCVAPHRRFTSVPVYILSVGACDVNGRNRWERREMCASSVW